MRRFLPVSLAAVALVALIGPAGAQTSIIDRPPMDLGADQIGVLQRAGEDMLFPERTVDSWFDAGTSFPVGNLKDRNIDPGLLIRFNDTFWRDGSLSMFGSVGALFGNDSYFNDAQDAIYASTPPVSPGDPFYPYTGVDIQSRYFWMVPMTVNLALALPVAESVSPFVAFGPGVTFTHESIVTSAVNNGLGDQILGDAEADPVELGPGGEQGISPYAVRTVNQFHPGFDLRGGIGFKAGSGDRPMWIRGVVSASTYYNHSHPSTNLGFALSFGR
jgi:hypothetical protein